MKKILFTLSLAGIASFSSMAHAADASKPVAFWLCSDFLEVNETVQPTALGFVAAVNHKGNVQEAVLDVDGVAKLQPTVVTYCKENPKVALRDALVQANGRVIKQ